MREHRFTAEDVMSWHPCAEYTLARLKKLCGPHGITARQMFSQRLPAADRLWAVLRPEVIPTRELRLLACDFAESVLPIFERERPADPRPREAIRLARLFADGEATREQMAAARAAARDAAWAAEETKQIRMVKTVLKRLAKGTK